MSINYYGMPMQKSSVGLDVLFNAVETTNAAGGELIFLDPELAEKIYALSDIEEDMYEELSAQAKEEFAIAMPTPSSLASFWEFAGLCISAAADAALQFVKDYVQFGAELISNVVGGVTTGLFSGSGGPILLIAAAVAAFILLK